MKKFFLILIIILIMINFLHVSKSHTQNYYVSNSGNDNNSGLSEAQPWKTISKVNSYNFKPGDVIHFKCGDIWREQLIPVSGNENGSITYTSYGTGNKPSLYGSLSKSATNDWIEERPNIWVLNKNNDGTQSVVSNINLNRFSIFQGNDAKVKYDNTAISNGYIKIDSLSKGNSMSSIQLMLRGLNIEVNKTYKLSFKAKSTIAFRIPKIILMQSDSPWALRYSESSDLSPMISTDWTTYSIYYKANYSDPNGRITFCLGSAFPEGSTLYLSDVNFVKGTNPNISIDVGNIIFNDGEAVGIKIFSESALNSQNKFWYDKNNQTIKIYSSKNPAEMYSKIECALRKCIIDQSNKSYVIYDGLDLRYGGSHGIFGENTDHISILNCDISYIGGGIEGNTFWRNGTPVRYGNGVEFWNNAHDNLVSDCRLFEIYDTAVTNQGNGSGGQQYNITYRNNIISNCEYSYECWYKNINSNMQNISFENNNCKNAGYGWSHAQKPGPSGIHLRFATNNGGASNIAIKNNILDTAAESIVHLDFLWSNTTVLSFIGNKYSQYINGTVLCYKGYKYVNSQAGTCILPINQYTDVGISKIIMKWYNVH